MDDQCHLLTFSNLQIRLQFLQLYRCLTGIRDWWENLLNMTLTVIPYAYIGGNAYFFHRSIHRFIRLVWYAYMRHQAMPLSIYIMACRLFGAKPLSEPMLDYCQLDPWIQHFLLKEVHLKMLVAKCRPYCLGLNVFNSRQAKIQDYIFLVFGVTKHRLNENDADSESLFLLRRGRRVTQKREWPLRNKIDHRLFI